MTALTQGVVYEYSSLLYLTAPHRPQTPGYWHNLNLDLVCCVVIITPTAQVLVLVTKAVSHVVVATTPLDADAGESPVVQRWKLLSSIALVAEKSATRIPRGVFGRSPSASRHGDSGKDGRPDELRPESGEEHDD